MRRQFETWFEGLIIGGVLLLLALLGLALTHWGLFEAMENVALDVLLQLRAKQYTPSEDIVVLAMDHQTVAYARENPQLGIKSRILPRRYLAQIADYVRRQGARAMVFDVEFKLPQTPQDDQALRRALSKFPRGSLFLAARADTPLEDAYPLFKTTVQVPGLAIPLPGGYVLPLTQETQEVPRTAQATRQDQRTLVDHLLTPQWFVRQERLAYVSERLAGGKASEENVQRVSLPLAMLANAFWRPQTLAAWGNQPHPYSIPPATPSALAALRTAAVNAWVSPAGSAGADYAEQASSSLAQRLYEPYERDMCLRQNYGRFYDRQEGYLAFLQREGLPVRVPPGVSPQSRRAIAYCFADSVQADFQLPNAHLGITNVLYERDSFERTAPVLKRLYNGSYHTYLGIRPALALLGSRDIVFDDQTFRVDGRVIPLHKHQNVMINWRDPARLPVQIISRAYTEMLQQAQDLGPVARLNAALPPALRLNSYAMARYGFLPRTSAAMFAPDSLLASWQAQADQARAFYASRPNEPTRRYLLGAPADFGYLNQMRLEKVDYQPALGNAHLYRKISVSDVLRQLAPQPPSAPTRAEPIYRLDGMPNSGTFSFKDKIVIYGDTMDDIHRTPMGRIFGPEVVATVLDMMLHDRKFVDFSSPGICFTIALLICVPMVWICLKLDGLPTIACIALLMIAGYFLGAVGFFLNGPVSVSYYTYLLGPLLLLLLALMGALTYRHVVQNRERRMLTDAFSRYVSPQLMSAILNEPARVMDNLKGGKQELTVLFADLRNFTSTFEDEDPETMVAQLNEYFDVMTNIILAHQGTYDKYMGDAIMAFFGAPVPFSDHARKACQAALAMCEALNDLNAKWVAEGKAELGIGVGLSTGEMFVGNFGSQRIKNFTVMGSAVNLGARLEAYTREAGMPVVISQRTFEQAQPDVQAKPLGDIRVKGFSGPVQAFGLLSAKDG